MDDVLPAGPGAGLPVLLGLEHQLQHLGALPLPRGQRVQVPRALPRRRVGPPRRHVLLHARVGAQARERVPQIVDPMRDDPAGREIALQRGTRPGSTADRPPRRRRRCSSPATCSRARHTRRGRRATGGADRRSPRPKPRRSLRHEPCSSTTRRTVGACGEMLTRHDRCSTPAPSKAHGPTPYDDAPCRCFLGIAYTRAAPAVAPEAGAHPARAPTRASRSARSNASRACQSLTSGRSRR